MRMRRADFAGGPEEARALLDRAGIVHLATTGEDGHPILRVVHAVVDGDVVAFHAAPAGEKMEALGRQAVVSAHEVVAEIPSWFLDPERACPATTFYLSAQVDGILEPIEDLARKARILQALMTKYQPEGLHVPIRAKDPLYTKALKGLLVAGVHLDNLACKVKLGQNRKLAERTRIVEQLWRRGGPGDARAVDLLCRRYPETAPAIFGKNGLRFGCGLTEEDLPEIGALLDDVYWLEGVPRERVLAAILSSSAVVTARDESGTLVGFARAVSDGRIAWVYDVIVHAAARRSGAGTLLMELLLDHPALRSTWQVRLKTRDASGFYRRMGFAELDPAAPRAIEMVRRAG
jgi:nitroimidazol reductase NimA-like FMN-containing flavoprotein (pyridoxamine 5'-phosphate oxidase superfamily)/N-acetylglutamate synthase-like GNAT family acetyltransferase